MSLFIIRKLSSRGAQIREGSTNASQSVWKTGCVVGIAVKTQRLALGVKQHVSVYVQALSLTSLSTSNLSVPQFLEL